MGKTVIKKETVKRKGTSSDPNFISLRMEPPKEGARNILEGVPCSKLAKGTSVILEDTGLISTGMILSITENSITTKEGTYNIYKTKAK